MTEAVIVSTARTALTKSFRGSFNDTEAPVLGGHVVRAVVERAGIEPAAVEDVIMGAAVQQGTQAYNIGRLCAYTGGLPDTVPGTTINRLCGSGMDAIAIAARQIKAGEADLIVAGGVESMSRAPFVMPKAETAFSRQAEIHDTTIGWRFINPLMRERHGIDFD